MKMKTLDEKINDIKHGKNLWKYVYDDHWFVRAAVASQGAFLEELKDDKDEVVRKIASQKLKEKDNEKLNEIINEIEQGKNLEQYIHDEYWLIRATVAEQGAFLDELKNDESEFVRATVAAQGAFLDELKNDESEFVRAIVAAQRLKEKTMKITDIKIGDIVCDKKTKFPMVVVGIFTDVLEMYDIRANGTTKDIVNGTVYLDFEGNQGDMWEADIKDLEFVK